MLWAEELCQHAERPLEQVATPLSHWHHWYMKAYSEDLRTKIVQAVERGMSKTRAAKTFGVSRSSVKRYVGSVREGEPLAPKRHPGSKPKLDERARRLLEADVEERPALTLKERCRFVERVVGVSVSESTLSRLLGRMGFSPKGKVWVRVRETSS
jgi:transposase